MCLSNMFGFSVPNVMHFLFFRSIEQYGKSNSGSFDGMALLQALGSFLGVFFGAFALGSAMGCVTALVSLS